MGMSDSKKFSCAVLLSVATGLSLPAVRFDRLHEAIEHLIGEPVWTHQLASPDTWAKARARLVDQHAEFDGIDGADLRAACEGKSNEDRTRLCDEWLSAKLLIVGRGRLVTKGIGRPDDVAAKDAFESLAAIGKPVLVIQGG